MEKIIWMNNNYLKFIINKSILNNLIKYLIYQYKYSNNKDIHV